MKKNILDPKSEAEKTLGITNSIKRVKPDNDLFEKIGKRMDNEKMAKHPVPFTISLIKYAAAFLLFAANLYFIIPEFSDQGVSERENHLENLASEYALIYSDEGIFEIN